MIVPRNTRLGTPEFVFVGVPDAIIRRYVDSIEINIKQHSTIAIGIFHQYFSSNPAIIEIIALNAQDYFQTPGDTKSNAFTAETGDRWPLLVIKDDRPGGGFVTDIIFERKEASAPILSIFRTLT